MKKSIISVALVLIMAFSLFNVIVLAATATPTSSTVLVNGKNVAFDAYNIGGSNFFKLRDLAYTLNGTPKQFEVGYDNATKAITLTSGKAYTSVDGDMEGKGNGSKEATPTTSRIFMDGKEVQFSAYNIGGNNYFKLRDIGAAFDFGVDWDQAAKTIRIDTSKGYTPEGVSVSTQMYTDWPTVPDYGVITGATLENHTVLDSGSTTYFYDLHDAAEGGITAYGDALKENGFSFVTSYYVDENIRLMYNKGDVNVSIGVRSLNIVVTITKKAAE